MGAENLAFYFDALGVDATLAGNAVRAIVDTQSQVELDGVVSQAPVAQLATTQAASAAPGQAFVASAVTYTVRQVLRDAPDGATTRLVLAR